MKAQRKIQCVVLSKRSQFESLNYETPTVQHSGRGKTMELGKAQ